MLCYMYAFLKFRAEIGEQYDIPDHKSAKSGNQHCTGGNVFRNPRTLIVFGRQQINDILNGGIDHLGYKDQDQGYGDDQKIRSRQTEDITQNKDKRRSIKMIAKMALGFGRIDYTLNSI